MKATFLEGPFAGPSYTRSPVYRKSHEVLKKIQGREKIPELTVISRIPRLLLIPLMFVDDFHYCCAIPIISFHDPLISV